MSVYVDALFTPPPGAPRCFRGGCCHLTADSLDELLRFARRLGLRERWLQDRSRDDRFHFDVTAAVRGFAVRLGAIEVSPLELVELMERRANRLAERAQAIAEVQS